MSVQMLLLELELIVCAERGNVGTLHLAFKSVLVCTVTLC
jgi:hypothetical protein